MVDFIENVIILTEESAMLWLAEISNIKSI